MAKLFLSYDRDDADKAQAIAGALEKAGHDVWWDRHIRGGAEYSEEIEQALDSADAVIVLWSRASVKSAWVRDEAAAGRDSGRLVPVLVEPINPPMGFRQYQSVDLAGWSPRRRSSEFDELLKATQELSRAPRHDPVPGRPASPASPASPATARAWAPSLRRWGLVAIAGAILIAAAIGARLWLARGGLPVVEVAAANASPKSQAAASDLYVKLGSLAQIGQGKWQLVDTESAPRKSDLVFRAADLGTPQSPRANVVLLDRRDNSLLWSREFVAESGGEADLRQLLSFTAGRVLGCELETRQAGGLPRDIHKMFLATCAGSDESSVDNYAATIGSLRAILARQPRFVPAWSRLLDADLLALDYASFGQGSIAEAKATLRADMAAARKLSPDLPALVIADVALLPESDYSGILARLDKAVATNPDDPQLLSEQGNQLTRVGQMMRSAQLAKRAADLDPLSPTATGNYILALAHAGQVDEAQRELGKMEKIWAGTGALRDTLWAFHLRYGDPQVARQNGRQIGDWYDVYLQARAKLPGAAERWLAMLRSYAKRPIDQGWGLTLMGLGGFGTAEDMLQLLARVPADELAENSYLLFRPALDPLRRDPRFMAVAARAGLVEYWRASGEWPDYCNTSDLPYDCKTEAARYAA